MQATPGELHETKSLTASKDTIVSVKRYRGISTSSHIIKYGSAEIQVSHDSGSDDLKNVYKEDVKTREPKYEITVVYESKNGGLKMRTFKCGTRGSPDAVTTSGEFLEDRRKKFGPILVDYDSFEQQSIDATGGILNPKFWEKNLDWFGGDDKQFINRLVKIDRLLQQKL